MKREAQRAQRAQQPAVAAPAMLRQNAQREAEQAEQRAKDELARRIAKLSNIIGKSSLPADTPVWLRLRAIIDYAGTDMQQLAQRTDLQDMQARFFALIANDATVLPTQEELINITLALEKHISKNKRMLQPQKSKLLDNMRAEMAELLNLVAVGG